MRLKLKHLFYLAGIVNNQLPFKLETLIGLRICLFLPLS
jgi:hypothetical protein